MIWPEASKAQHGIAAASALGSTVCVLIRRLSSSCNRSMAFVVRMDRHWLGSNLTYRGLIPPKLIRVRPMKGRTHETSAIYRRADYRRVLREHEAGAKTADLARKHGVSEATLYNWKAKFGGMDVSEAKRLKQLEAENAKLKKLLAEQMLDAGCWMLDAAALRELLSKKW